MDKNQSLTQKLFDRLIESESQVTLYLTNGIKLTNISLAGFDRNVLVFNNHYSGQKQVVYRKAMASMMPNVRLDLKQIAQSVEISLESPEDQALSQFANNRLNCNSYLINGICLKGQILNSDEDTLLIDGVMPQIINKSAISTITPEDKRSRY